MDDKNTNKQLRIYDSSSKFIRASVDEAIARDLNKWQGWQCSAGVRGLYIDYDGNLWKCNTASSKLDRFDRAGWQTIVMKAKPTIAEDDWMIVEDKLSAEYRKTKDVFKRVLSNTAESKKEYPGFLGNIYDGYDLPTSWFICPWKQCGCGADVVLSKVKSPIYKSVLAVTHAEYAGRDSTAKNLVDEITDTAAVEMNFPVPYQILWDISRRCNYDCSYCWPAVHNRTDDHKDYDLLIKTSDRLINEWANGQMIRWNFGGGEPTLHPQFVEWMKYLKSKNQWTLVTSNGTRDYRYWTEAVKYLNSINLSVHFDGLVDEKDEDRFVRNVKVICEHFDEHNDDHWLEIKIMTPPQYVTRALKLKQKILDLGMLDKPGANDRIKGVLSLVPIRSMGDSGTLVEYSEEDLEIFKHQ